jgi:hypothetical protein
MYCYNYECMTAGMCEVADTLGRVVKNLSWKIREFVTELVYTRYRRKEDISKCQKVKYVSI